MAQRHSVCRTAPCGVRRHRARHRGCDVCLCQGRADHLRIDTHRDNLPMQGASIKAGFERAGVVYVSDGTARVAFDWLREA